MTQMPASTPPPGAPPGYPQQPPTGPSLPIGLSITALILGILSFALCCVGTRYINLGEILGLVAIIIGFVAIQKAGRGQQGGRGLAVAGVVLGIINILLNIAMLMALIFGGPRIKAWVEQKTAEIERQSQQQMNDTTTPSDTTDTEGTVTEPATSEPAP